MSGDFWGATIGDGFGGAGGSAWATGTAATAHNDASNSNRELRSMEPPGVNVDLTRLGPSA